MENTYIQLLRNAPKAKIIDLVNYIEGMPEQLKMTVKMHLKDDWMLDALDIKNERDLKLSRYSTLAKYFKDADDKSSAFSMLQREYCDIVNLIEISNMKLPNKRGLLRILDAECYDADTLRDVELKISELIDDTKYTSDATKDDISYIKLLTEKVMPYKGRVYDIYTELIIDNVSDTTIAESNHMFMMETAIANAIKSGTDYSALHDAGSLIYLYFKELGCDEVFEKYDLTARFDAYMSAVGNYSEYDIDTVHQRITELAIGKMTTVSVIKELIAVNKYLPDGGFNLKRNEQIDIEGNNSLEIGEFIFLSKDIGAFSTFSADEVSRIKSITPQTAIEYLPHKTNIHNIIFELSDNDIGHLSNLREDHITLGTCYDKLTGELRYVGVLDGTHYVFFMDRAKVGSIFGLSIDSDADSNKKLINITKSKSFHYHFYSTI